MQITSEAAQYSVQPQFTPLFKLPLSSRSQTVSEKRRTPPMAA
jgi:hypothetical protein